MQEVSVLKILLVGDIFGECGMSYIQYALRDIVARTGADMVIANGENASGGHGISYGDYDTLMDIGVDVVTMGNHTFGRKDILKIFENEHNIIRPINYPEGTPGAGSVIVNRCAKKIGVINALGRVNVQSSANCPFEACKKAVEEMKDKADIILVDFHADATSEKRALGFFLDGSVTCVFGTHTHVQTADNCILPKGTAYITDLGMTGAQDSVLGVDKNIIIDRFISAIPQKFEHATGKAKLCGALLCVDDDTNKAVSIELISERE